MNSIPENWIPFIAVHVPNDNRTIQLQRAAVPSAVDATPVRPRTALLREGLDAGKPRCALSQTTTRPLRQRVRLYATVSLVPDWGTSSLLMKYCVGRGEGSSGLAFDLLVDIPRDNQ